MAPVNIKEFRELMDRRLRDERLEQLQLQPEMRPKRPQVWALPPTDIIRFFHPHAVRRPWGFSFGGGVGIEIPELRRWLDTHKPGEKAGIFRLNFVVYHTANEDVLNDFMIEFGQEVPGELWAGLIRDRLERIPASLEALVASYRRNREELGWLAHPHQRHAWNFLLSWIENPDPAMPVPRQLPTGHIV